MIQAQELGAPTAATDDGRQPVLGRTQFYIKQDTFALLRMTMDKEKN
jgi:hypothetical protein